MKDYLLKFNFGFKLKFDKIYILFLILCAFSVILSPNVDWHFF